MTIPVPSDNSLRECTPLLEMSTFPSLDSGKMAVLDTTDSVGLNLKCKGTVQIYTINKD